MKYVFLFFLKFFTLLLSILMIEVNFADFTLYKFFWLKSLRNASFYFAIVLFVYERENVYFFCWKRLFQEPSVAKQKFKIEFMYLFYGLKFQNLMKAKHLANIAR